MALNEQLAKALELVGIDPFAEPELYTALDEKLSVIETVLKRADLSTTLIDELPAAEVAEFYHSVRERITGYRLPDKTFKTTPGTENCGLPNFRQAEAITAAGKKYATLLQTLEAGAPVADQYVEAVMELDRITWEVSGLNKDDLTEWEQGLVAQQVMASVAEIEKTALGKL